MLSVCHRREGSICLGMGNGKVLDYDLASKKSQLVGKSRLGVIRLGRDLRPEGLF